MMPSENAMLARFRGSSESSARRAVAGMQTGMEQINDQMVQPKTSVWPNTTAGLLDNLRNNALDGVDAACGLGLQSADEGQSIRADVQRSSHVARQALYSNPSPAVAANTFFQVVGPFHGACLKVYHQLRSYLYPAEHEQQRQTTSSLLAREKPTEKEDPYAR